MKQSKALNVAIVGGGPGCKAIMDMIFAEKLRQLQMRLIGVASTNPQAVGYCYAREKGYYTTTDYRDLFELEGLDMIVELTGRDEIANEIARTKPENIHLMNHVMARLFWDVFQLEEALRGQREEAEEAFRESEQRYRNVYDTAPLAFVIWDRECRITDWNECAEKMFGWSREEVLGRNFFEFLIPESVQPRIEDVVESLLSGTVEPDVVNENITKDGEVILCRWNNSILRDNEGSIIGAMSLGLNITSQKNSEQALRASEEKYSTLVENSLIGIYIDQDGKIVFANKRFAEIYGYLDDEIIGMESRKFVHPDDRSSTDEIRARRLRGEAAPSQYEARGLTKDGEAIWILRRNTRIEYEGRPAILGNIADVTEQKRLEAKLLLAQKMEAIGTLAGGIAHDFNNLLMGIQGNVSLMLMGVDPDHHDFGRLKNIEKQIQSGARLTSHLLGYARKGQYEVKPVDLNYLLEGTSDTFARTRKEITIRRELAKDLFPVEADPAQIEQVLLNLFVNAADAMPGGGKLTLKTMNVTHKDMKAKLYEPKPGSYVLLTVTDTGTGIYKKTIDRIFDPFFTTKEMGRGTGLGLASAYGIMKAHGGYIDVDSKRGRGTTFSIYLPVSEKEVQKIAKTPKQAAKGARTVLLVDDEEVVLDVGKELLEATGYTVLTAKDGREAVRVYKKSRDSIDIVVLDMVMPNMGGGEAYDRLREINPDVKVILSSGFSIDGEASEILERGCDGFIQKPFSIKQLSDRINDTLG